MSILTGRLPQQGNANHTIAIVKLDAGKTSDPHFHLEREESYLILEGSGEAIIDEQTLQIMPGDIISTRPKERHQFRASINDSMSYLVITTPAWVPTDSHS